ncbi:hypothetical protein ABZ461_13080 [Actinacidiphila glaucinigra]|uniref:hypothetical protein n=1 Tax=Actinacidiphila glaucinigra TaxID=235986 RepID=UPI0033D0A9DA
MIFVEKASLARKDRDWAQESSQPCPDFSRRLRNWRIERRAVGMTAEIVGRFRRARHLAATTLAKIGESDISWLAAERAMRAADESDDPLVLASAARSGTHALLANGRYDDALELGNATAGWLASGVEEGGPEALSLLGMIHLRAAIAAARHQDRATATGLLVRAEWLADDLGSDENYWQTGFGPTNFLLHRISIELDLDNVSYVVEHGRINVDHMPQERSVSHRIDYARALS